MLSPGDAPTIDRANLRPLAVASHPQLRLLEAAGNKDAADFLPATPDQLIAQLLIEINAAYPNRH